MKKKCGLFIVHLNILMYVKKTTKLIILEVVIVEYLNF